MQFYINPQMKSKFSSEQVEAIPRLDLIVVYMTINLSLNITKALIDYSVILARLGRKESQKLFK